MTLAELNAHPAPACEDVLRSRCTAPRWASDLLATLHARLANDPATERAVALRELGAINRIRIAGTVNP